MNNLSYWLARIYYRLIGISVNPIPATFKAEYWAERIHRYIAGLPSGLSGGKPVQFWLESWFYSVTGQSHRLATGTQAAWFWLSKLYAHYAGLPLNGMLVPASDEFWASKLLEVVSGSVPPPVTSPEIRVVANGINTANGDTRNAGSETQGGSLTFQVVAHNDGTGDLIVANPTASGDISVGTFAPGLTITPGNSAAFTVTCDTSVIGTGLTGQLSFANNDSDENPFVINVTFDVTAVPMPEMRVSIDSNIVTDGGSYNLGNTTQGTDIVKTVTIENIGSANLTVTSPPVTGGDVSAGAISSTTITPGNSATFTLTANGSLAGGAKSGTVSIANNDSDENPYNWTVNFTVLAPEMRVVIDAGTVADGGTVDVGTVDVGSALQKTVTIYNDGDADLVVTSPPVTGGDVTAGAISGTTITPGNNATFTLTVSTSTPGSKSGTVSIANNDFDENPYNWTVTATVNNTYVYFVTNTIAPVRWYRFRETSGTNEPNAINPGTNDATISGCTLGQIGQLGANNAYDYDGVDDYVLAPAGADINGILPATWIILLKVDSRGEGNFARLINKASDVVLFIDSADATSPYSVTAQVNFSGGQLSNTWANVLPVSTWTLLALRINADNTLDLFMNGAKQTTSAAGSGAKSSSANGAYLGNNALQTATTDGLIDEIIVENSAVSDANNLTLAQLAGLA